MNTALPQSDSAADQAAQVKTWSPAVRAVASIFLAFHVAAVFMGPFGVPPTSTLVRTIADWVFHPYHEVMFLDHGYKFFAPGPGPSHLVYFEVERDDGSVVNGVFPNLKVNWPRLLYHRHFMLSEFLNAGPPDPTWFNQPDWQEQVPSEWQKTWARSYASHLAQEYEGKRVKIILRRHLLPAPDQVAEGMRLDDARLYREKLLGTWTREQL